MEYSVEKVSEESFGKLKVCEKRMTYNGTQWRYTVSGSGNTYILALLSNVAGQWLALPLAEEFMDSCTTIALSVPPMPSFEKTADGLYNLLMQEQVEKCYGIGHSNGGVHLQNLIQKHPQIVDKIVFSHSLTSMNENDAYTTNASELKVYQLTRKILKVLPVSILTSALSRMALNKLVLKAGKPETERLLTLCRQTLKQLTKKDFLTMADCMEDFLYHYTFTPEPYINRPQDVLIVDSPTDKIANPMQRAQMLRLCPGAQEYHFKTGGHVTLINCQEEYLSLLHRFWRV